jgi:DNA-binding NtrC family response regulator
MADVSEIPSSPRTMSHPALAAELSSSDYTTDTHAGNPIVITQPIHRFSGAEEVHEEESLSIADKEKELIMRALKKHKGKRKEAAFDLGISERTLYRKIKEYDIKE